MQNQWNVDIRQTELDDPSTSVGASTEGLDSQETISFFQTQSLERPPHLTSMDRTELDDHEHAQMPRC